MHVIRECPVLLTAGGFCCWALLGDCGCVHVRLLQTQQTSTDTSTMQKKTWHMPGHIPGFIAVPCCTALRKSPCCTARNTPQLSRPYLCINCIKSVLCVHKHGKLALLLHLCNGMQGQCGLATGFWPKDLNNTALGVATTQGTIQGQAARGEALTAREGGGQCEVSL